MPVNKQTNKAGQIRRMKPRSRASKKTKKECPQKPALVFTRNKGPSDYAAESTVLVNGQINKARTSSKSTSHDGVDEAQFDPTLDLSTYSKPRSMSMPNTIPNSSLLEHIATSRFFHHYGCPKRTFYRLELDYISSVIDNATNRGILAEIIIALGILTWPSKSPASRLAARCRYARALRLTNQALVDAKQTNTDEVLMAVILLGCYETTPDKDHSMISWTSHLDGARQLLCMRGREMLKSGATYHMFGFLRVQILLNCFMTMQRVPSDFVDLSNSIGETHEGEEKASCELVHLFARMCNLIASAQEGVSENVITEAIILDNDLTEWASTVPPGLEISVEPATPETKAYADYYETYCSVFSAEIWMLYRLARIGVNGLIASPCGASLASMALQQNHSPSQPGSPDEKQCNTIVPQMQERLDIVEATRIDMCATVPFLLDRHETQPPAVCSLPLCDRTPAVNLLLMITKTAGASERICSWATGLMAEVQAGDEADHGAVWMNSSHDGISK